MEQKRDLAIVLRSVPYEERHRVITALTENHGKVSALARNSIQSRRFGGALEPFAASEWRFVERVGADLLRVEEAEIKRSYEGLRKDFLRLSLASVFSELMIKLAPEREPCPELFKLHSNALATLEELPEGFDEIALLNGYMAKVMQWNGSQPQLLNCLGCQTSLQQIPSHQTLSCLVADAGWVCSRCRDADGAPTRQMTERQGQHFQQMGLRVGANALQDFLMSLNTPIKQIPHLLRGTRQEHRALFSFIEALFTYHLPGFQGAPIKSLRFLNLT